MWKNIISIFILLSISSTTLAYKYCSDTLKYCINLPDNMVAVNSNNYKKYSNKIPMRIYDKFKGGSKRELVIEDRKKNPSFFIVDISKSHGRAIDIDGTCRLLRKVNDGELDYCGKLNNREGILATTYIRGETSFIRIWVRLNDKHIYIVSARKFRSMDEFRREIKALLDIVYTLQCYPKCGR